MSEIKVLVPMAKGFEEIEAIAVIDVLRRGGITVLMYGVNEREVTGAHGVTIKCDAVLGQMHADAIDMIVLPGGGGGTDILAKDPNVQMLLKAMDATKKPIGAICAAPLALKAAGVLKENYTCYPGSAEKIGMPGYHADKAVVTEGNVMTSRGPGTAICFGLEIVKKLRGEDVYLSLKRGLLAEYC